MNTAERSVKTYAWMKATSNSTKLMKTVKYRNGRHGCIDGCAELYRDKYKCGKSQHYSMPGHDIGKKTYHQRKGFGEQSHYLNNWHKRYWHL